MTHLDLAKRGAPVAPVLSAAAAAAGYPRI